MGSSASLLQSQQKSKKPEILNQITPTDIEENMDDEELKINTVQVNHPKFIDSSLFLSDGITQQQNQTQSERMIIRPRILEQNVQTASLRSIPKPQFIVKGILKQRKVRNQEFQEQTTKSVHFDSNIFNENKKTHYSYFGLSKQLARNLQVNFVQVSVFSQDLK